MTNGPITPEELIAFVGAEDPDASKLGAQAESALLIADSLAGSYCRGRHKWGSSYRAGVRAVVLTAAARILANPGQIQVREQVGPYTMLKGAGFNGFTLVELAVLDRYRKRAI